MKHLNGFIKKIDLIIESVVDPTRKELDPKLFDENQLLRDEVLGYLNDIKNKFEKYFRIDRAIIKGSILSYQWIDTTDVDVLFEIDEDVTEGEIKKVLNIIGDDFVVPNTEHPVQVYLYPGEYDNDMAEGIYDFDKGWIKGPYNVTARVDDYIKQFNSVVNSIDIDIQQLRRDIIDYKILHSLTKEEVAGLRGVINKTLKSINQTVDELLEKRDDIKDARKLAYSDDVDIEQLKKYKSRNLLPGNVVYKMLERYYYVQLLNKIDELYEDDEITDDEIKLLGQYINDMLSISESNDHKNLILEMNVHIVDMQRNMLVELIKDNDVVMAMDAIFPGWSSSNLMNRANKLLMFLKDVDILYDIRALFDERYIQSSFNLYDIPNVGDDITKSGIFRQIYDMAKSKIMGYAA